MNESAVISYIISRWIVWALVFVFLSVLFIAFSCIPLIKKYRGWLIILLLLVTLYAAIPTVTGLIDITEESYVIEQVYYYRSDDANTRNSLTASESIQITTADGETIILKGATHKLPCGQFTGTITYAKRSKIVISFVPD